MRRLKPILASAFSEILGNPFILGPATTRRPKSAYAIRAIRFLLPVWYRARVDDRFSFFSIYSDGIVFILMNLVVPSLVFKSSL